LLSDSDSKIMKHRTNALYNTMGGTGLVQDLSNKIQVCPVGLNLQWRIPLRSYTRMAGIGIVLLFFAAGSAVAQSTASQPLSTQTVPDFLGITKPSWLPVATVTAKEGYDSDLYGVSATPAGHPNVANFASSYTTISAGFTLNLLAASGIETGGILTTLTLSYGAEYTAYTQAAREDNLRNTLTLTLKGRSGPWTFSVENPFLYVDGSKEDPFYSTYSVLGYAATRERRNQIQERNTSFLRYDAKAWLVRAVANATYYNLLIDEHNPVGAYKGYINWVNRDDINTGADIGYKLTPDLALIAGWRIGQQTQARPYYSLVDNDNVYNRALLGLEGKLLSWLQLQLATGPDFRRYTDIDHPGLAGNRHTWLYTQGQLTATLSSADSLVLSNKIWHFVSSPGLTSDQETSTILTYKHAFSKQLSVSLGAGELEARYDAPTVRDDWDRSFPLDVTYAFSPSFALSANYANTEGHSLLSETSTPGRNFTDNSVSLSFKAAF
jgi:hypothetical protein